MHPLQSIIESAFERHQHITPGTVDGSVAAAIEDSIEQLDRGELRIAEKRDGNWVVNEWLKKAVLLYFRTHANAVIDAGYNRFYDKLPLKYIADNARAFAASGVRVVPGAIVRRGAFVAPNVVLMPSFVNIGAHIGEGTMVDTWATVGSCAQIGRNVHLSGGEPLVRPAVLSAVA